MLHERNHLRKIEGAELIPLCDQHRGIGLAHDLRHGSDLPQSPLAERSDGEQASRGFRATAKYLSIAFAVGAALLAGVLISLILVGILAPQALAAANLARVGLVFLIALAYVSLFVFLSLLVSAVIPRSSLALLALLAAWVLFSVVIPSMATVIMEKSSSAPREIQTARMPFPSDTHHSLSRGVTHPVKGPGTSISAL